ncbi:MAG: cysteine hydrolase family protein [Armatimonadota bacterium]
MTAPIARDDPYIGWRPRLPDPVLRREATALLVIDMQYADAHKDHGILKYRRDCGYTNGLEYMERRLEMIVPNIRRLQDACRALGVEVLFTRICAMTRDGRDRSLAHKELGLMAPPGSRDAEVLEELAPLGDEMVFDKTTGSVFNSTPIHYVLQNIGIRNLIMVGVMTGGCVESAARDAKDLGYRVIVVDDACGTWTHEMHEFALRVMGEVFAKINITAEVLGALHAATASADQRLSVR